MKLIKRPKVYPAWITTPGWGAWDPVTQTYSEYASRGPKDGVPTEPKRSGPSAAQLAALAKARAARAAKRTAA